MSANLYRRINELVTEVINLKKALRDEKDRTARNRALHDLAEARIQKDSESLYLASSEKLRLWCDISRLTEERDRLANENSSLKFALAEYRDGEFTAERGVSLAEQLRGCTKFSGSLAGFAGTVAE